MNKVKAFFSKCLNKYGEYKKLWKDNDDFRSFIYHALFTLVIIYIILAAILSLIFNGFVFMWMVFGPLLGLEILVIVGAVFWSLNYVVREALKSYRKFKESI